MTLAAVLMPIFLAAPSVDASNAVVRISLFTLFKPTALNLRVISGDAILESDGLAIRNIAHDESLHIRLAGQRLNISSSTSRRVLGPATFTKARISPVGPATLELMLPGKIKREVRGVLSVEAPDGRGPLRIVLTTAAESAVASVVAAEMISREAEALKTLAVVVRTYMLAHVGRHANEGFDFCDTTHCQLYRGEQDLRGTNSGALRDAVSRTAGQFLSYQGRAIEGYYGAVCGGLSTTPTMVWGGTTSYPYGRITCRWCRGSRFSRWERTADAQRIVQALSAFVGTNFTPATELIVVSDPPSGFVRSIVVRDGERRTEITADAFRRAVGLRLGWNTVLSPTFTIERRGSRFIFRGRGFGSQVGLCEAGAVAQAATGRGYRDILSFYYPGAEVREQTSHE